MKKEHITHKTVENEYETQNVKNKRNDPSTVENKCRSTKRESRTPNNLEIVKNESGIAKSVICTQ
jgi:hypothetical protein